MNDKTLFGMGTIAVIGVIQVAAFATGHDGQVFNFTSVAIGLIAGSILGISFNVKNRVLSNSMDAKNKDTNK